jgi:hypothetical protein
MGYDGVRYEEVDETGGGWDPKEGKQGDGVHEDSPGTLLQSSSDGRISRYGTLKHACASS